MQKQKVKIASPLVSVVDDHQIARYKYQTTKINKTTAEQKELIVTPVEVEMEMRCKISVPTRMGVMLVGWGGNNGSSFTGMILANKNAIKWESKTGEKTSNFYGSVFQSSTVPIGVSDELTDFGNRKEISVLMRDLLPMIDPCEIEIDGWDINSMDLASAMDRSKVFEPDLKRQLKPLMKEMRPRKSAFYSDFLASNQQPRADNVIDGDLENMLTTIRKDICDFRETKKLDHLIVLWTASTERFCEITAGVNDTAESLLNSIKQNKQSLVSPSTLFGVASVLEGCTFINGSPQNSLVPGLVELATSKGVHLAGDDFKTGQTKVKSSLVEFLMNSGIKPVSIVSYNHLGNNDGQNLSSQKQFRSKEITKSSVIDDMILANPHLYPNSASHPDHCIVIKYIPYVGDSKRAMDEYTSEICMNGSNTVVLHNTCEDSLLAVGVMLDLVMFAELCSRLSFRVSSSSDKTFGSLGSVLSTLSLFLKAPATSDDEPSINAFSRQRACIENLLRAFAGLPPNNNMLLEYKIKNKQGILDYLKELN